MHVREQSQFKFEILVVCWSFEGLVNRTTCIPGLVLISCCVALFFHTMYLVIPHSLFNVALPISLRAPSRF